MGKNKTIAAIVFPCVAMFLVIGGICLVIGRWVPVEDEDSTQGQSVLNKQGPQGFETPNEQGSLVIAEANASARQMLLDSSLSPTARNWAANRMRVENDPRVTDDLVQMLWDDRESATWRNYCVQHLFSCYEKQPDPATLDTLFQAAEADEKMVRICAVWSLSRVATPRDKNRMPDEETLGKICALALKALREKDAHFLITEAGVQSCARLGLTESLPEIRDLAGSDDTEPTHLRVVAVAALGELKDDESIPLLEKLSQEATEQLQAAAQLALKRIRESEAVEQPEPAPEDRF